MAGLHTNRGAKRAREARAALGQHPIAPLTCLLTIVEERARLAVIVTRGLPDEVAGACYREGAEVVLWVNGIQGPARQRFTLAHELGHVWCEHDGRLEPDSFATFSGRTTNPFEIEANAFAAELLLPRAAMRRVVKSAPSLDEVVVISAHYGVSAIVVLYRLGELGLLGGPRRDRLRAEIERRAHLPRYAQLGLARLDDRLGTLERLPYLSPALAGRGLEAALRRAAAVDADIARAIDRRLA